MFGLRFGDGGEHGEVFRAVRGGRGPSARQRDAARPARDADERAPVDAVRRRGLRRYGAVRARRGIVPARFHDAEARRRRATTLSPIHAMRWGRRACSGFCRGSAGTGRRGSKAMSWRSMARRCGGRSPLHSVRAFPTEARSTPGQVRAEARSNEVAAAPALLDMLALEGRTVTADAMRARRTTAAAVVLRRTLRFVGVAVVRDVGGRGFGAPSCATVRARCGVPAVVRRRACELSQPGRLSERTWRSSGWPFERTGGGASGVGRGESGGGRGRRDEGSRKRGLGFVSQRAGPWRGTRLRRRVGFLR